MSYDDILTSISREILGYLNRYGCEPVKIFMTTRLVKDLMYHPSHPIHVPYPYDPSKWQGYFMGIEVQPYQSDEYEYYLAERKGGFRVWPENI